MGLRTSIRGLAWAVCWLAAAPVFAQPPAAAPAAGQPGEPPKSPKQLFRSAQDLIDDGRYDVAAEVLKAFLAANPTDKDFLDITAGKSTAFLRLRNVPVWSEEPKAQAEAVKTVEEIIKRSEAANAKLYRDPARIDKFIRNLGATPEERIYAEDQLKKAGDAVVPVMVKALRNTQDNELRAGILLTVIRLGPETVPGFLGAFDGLPDDLRLGLLRSLSSRPDVLSLLSAADTDFQPHLWYYSGSKSPEAGSLRAFAVTQLEQITGANLGRRKPEAELTRIASAFVRHTARYRDPNRIRLWTWDPAKQEVVALDATKAQADEFYAVRYLRWALELSPTDTTAQEQFLTLTVASAVQRGKFGDLAKADAAVYQIAAATPTATLIGLLERALAEQNTALALGLTQVLSARADRNAVVGPSPTRTGVLVRALDYPDPRVQLAAAVGLLRAASAADHAHHAKVVDVLRRAAAIDQPAGGKEMGRALIADPVDMRGERVAGYFRQIGFATERFASGRDLLRRIARAADYDLIVIDRHVPNPELRDLLAQLRPDDSPARRPVLLIASSDKPRAPSFEQMLLRLAVLIAVTETSDIDVPPPYAIDTRRPQDQMAADRAANRAARDTRLTELFDLRLARLRRLVDAASLPGSHSLRQRLDVRLPHLTYAALAAEFGVSADNAPEVFKRYDALNRLVLAQPGAARVTEQISTAGLGRFAEQLDSALDAPRRQKVDQLLGRLSPESLGLEVDAGRDPEAEYQLGRVARTYRGVTVIAEPFSPAGLSDEVRSAAADPAQLPRDPAETKQAAKVAVEWLRRMAVGEVAGYDVRPAAEALRHAMRDDELAENAIEAVARIPTAEAQQDLLFVALSGMRPVPIRMRAAERTIQHVQQYGKLIPENQTTTLGKLATGEADLELKARLLVIYHILGTKPGDLGALMLRYPPPLPRPPAPPSAPAPEEKKPEPGKN